MRTRLIAFRVQDPGAPTPTMAVICPHCGATVRLVPDANPLIPHVCRGGTVRTLAWVAPPVPPTPPEDLIPYRQLLACDGYTFIPAAGIDNWWLAEFAGCVAVRCVHRRGDGWILQVRDADDAACVRRFPDEESARRAYLRLPAVITPEDLADWEVD